jgi:O-antigen ligase
VRARGGPTSFFFLATVFTVTFEKVHWQVAGTVELPDVLAILFLLGFALDRAARSDRRVPRSVLVAGCFLGAFLLVYLIGFFNLDTHQSLAQFAKGLIKFLIHFLFLLAGLAYVSRRGERYFWRTLGWFVGGMTVNAAYGVLQLLAARAGTNLDAHFLQPLTGGASAINVYGAVNGSSVYRPNALTGDPNHLGIMLDIPILVLLPIYLRLERGHRWKTWLAVLLGFLFLVELATLSRSGLLGLALGLLVLAVPYRRFVFSRELLVPLAGVAIIVAYVVRSRLHYFEVVLRSRIQTGGKSTSAHFGVYDFIPQVLHLHPLFGLGLNNFSVYYEFVTGKTNWGPHSFYVALIVETGLVGTALFAAFLYWIFRRLRAARAIGRGLAAARDPLAARVRPLAWGLTAALVATMAANAFYLTMSFYYFYVFAALCLAVPVVFARRLGA